MAEISRDPADLVAQMSGRITSIPTAPCCSSARMFAPIKDRDAPGQGFTHKIGDIVTDRRAGARRLVNRMRRCPDGEPWTFGASHLMRNLARRGLL